MAITITRPDSRQSSARALVQRIIRDSGVVFDGPNPWDPQILDERVFERFITDRSIAVGEGYMHGLWEVEDLPEFIFRVFRSGAMTQIYRTGYLKLLGYFLYHSLINLQTKDRSVVVGRKHYDIGNDLYTVMLGPSMTYTCGYWRNATNLEEAQAAKYDLICRKIGLKAGDRVLDIGCGWGGFAVFAAQRYGARVVGVTISQEQVAYANDLARKHGLEGLVEIRFQDYRDISDDPFDHIVSIGMFEHVGRKNFRVYMQTARRLLKPDGLFLLHTISSNRSVIRVDPFIGTYIFPGGYIPSVAQIASASNGLFVMEDWHTFGPDYARTLRAWFNNFDAGWPSLVGTKEEYTEEFYRMWKFYLNSCEAGFASRYLNLSQVVFSARGVLGGYTSVR